MKFQKNQTQKNSCKTSKKMKFDNGQQDILNAQQTSRARQIRLIDKSINALKLPSILPHINTWNIYGKC